ncbi:MAG: four-carbon acid sugar kinase family protein [Erysipelotrichaceae bacterium]
MYSKPSIMPATFLSDEVRNRLKQVVSARPHEKVVILDDDPTGTQTIHDYYVYTGYDHATLRGAFLDEKRSFFILTNSRSLFPDETAAMHREIARNLMLVSQELNVPFQLISRTDSTLRQHYPLETQVIHETMDACFDGEILIPALFGGNRFTVDDIHYVVDKEQWIPCDQTDYAKDKTFGYHFADLKEWIQEKTQGRYPADEVTSISLAELRGCDIEGITHKLNKVTNFNKVIVNAVEQDDLTVFVLALYQSLDAGKKFLYRTSASFINSFIDCTQAALLHKKDVVDLQNRNGGLIVVGSHVAKTTRQLEHLRNSATDISYVEFDQHRILTQELDQETLRVTQETDRLLKENKNVVVSTRRERIDFIVDDPEKQLAMTREIAFALMSVVKKLSVKPRFILAKGGITSSDIGTQSLGVSRALVIGQILDCVPVWKVEQGRYAGLPYIIFPGNIGTDDALIDIIQELTEETQ